MEENRLFDTMELNDSKGSYKTKTPVTCLGKTFPSDDDRRAYFRDELRKKLPELKKIEGFPIGEDDDIINLSDPPYYTACPNPWLNDFIAEWEEEKKDLESKKKRKADFEVHEPYASDVSEGKNNPIYNAHSYHTKVPHPAIMRYILHYTQPGDIVFDGFAGTGMTGVAAQLCDNPGTDLKMKIETEYNEMGLAKPVWGARKAICGDLSPIASFIAYNYNTPVDVDEFEREARHILEEVEEECGWLYETNHINPQTKKRSEGKGRINYTVWSDVFVCPNCGGEIVFWDAAVNKEAGQVLDEFPCGHCQAKQTKDILQKAMVTAYDQVEKKTYRKPKTIPVFIDYTYTGKRYKKNPDKDDLTLLKNIEEMQYDKWYPTDQLPGGDEIGRAKNDYIFNIHQYYTIRSIFVLANIYFKCMNKSIHKFMFTSTLFNLTKLYRWRANNKGGTTSGTYYICATPQENNVINSVLRKSSDISKLIKWKEKGVLVNCFSLTKVPLNINTVDYIFTDPPFGSNIMYSELNFLWESWLKVKTNNKNEAIENSVQGKTLFDYQNLMLKCFQEYYRILKPGKWMTVEFSNTSAAVWNGIQASIQRAGFVIANVAALDKKQLGFKAIVTPTAVKQDLVISCYKPSSEFDEKFKKESSDVNVWLFVAEHLSHLPVVIIKLDKALAVVEREPRILYDRLITFYLMRGLPIPIDAADFQLKLKQKFSERDGKVFTSEQAAEYDKMIKKYGDDYQADLFNSIYTEEDGIFWLKQRLETKPQKYQDIQPEFRKANTATRKGEKEIELKTILEENFIELSDGKWRAPDPSEAKDREILRTKALLKEFGRYVEELDNPKTKKLKDVRVEALRAGFKHCWEKKDYKTIYEMGEKIPQNLLMEDEQLLMFYDIAKDKV